MPARNVKCLWNEWCKGEEGTAAAVLNDSHQSAGPSLGGATAICVCVCVCVSPSLLVYFRCRIWRLEADVGGAETIGGLMITGKGIKMAAAAAGQ